MSNKLIDNKELMKEWNYQKNKNILPENVKKWVHKKYGGNAQSVITSGLQRYLIELQTVVVQNVHKRNNNY